MRISEGIGTDFRPFHSLEFQVNIPVMSRTAEERSHPYHTAEAASHPCCAVVVAGDIAAKDQDRGHSNALKLVHLFISSFVSSNQ